MSWLMPITLIGDTITLVPLSNNYYNGLVEAVKDGELWKLWYTLIPEPHKMQEEIDRRLDCAANGAMLPFVVIENSTNKVLGMTTFLNLDQANQRLEIGGTWYRNSAQRTGVNTSVKLLLLMYAFESLNCVAVEFRTHFFNQRSRLAIERIGAKLDGILRNHMVMPNGTLRDTCVYSILATEWPAVKTHLRWLMNKPR